MTIHTLYSVTCTACNRRELSDQLETHWESPEEAIEVGVSKGWGMQILAPNGSRWDFCPSCYTHHLNEQKENPSCPK